MFQVPCHNMLHKGITADCEVSAWQCAPLGCHISEVNLQVGGFCG